MYLQKLLVLLLFAFDAARCQPSPPCSHFGRNWVAEIRCLRNLLERCQAHYYSLSKAYDDEVELLPVISSQKLPPQQEPTATTTQTASSAPLTNEANTNISELRATLTEQFNDKVRELEAKVEKELQEMEEESEQKIDEVMRRTENEIRKLNKTVKLMTRRIHRYRSAEYIYMDEEESWYGAEERCIQWGGHLVSIKDGAENLFVSGIHSAFVWIGLNDIQNENKYVWSDRSNSKFRNWEGGQPDNGDHNENCVEMDGYGFWSDAFCFQARHFICKRT